MAPFSFFRIWPEDPNQDVIRYPFFPAPVEMEEDEEDACPDGLSPCPSTGNAIKLTRK